MPPWCQARSQPCNMCVHLRVLLVCNWKGTSPPCFHTDPSTIHPRISPGSIYALLWLSSTRLIVELDNYIWQWPKKLDHQELLWWTWAVAVTYLPGLGLAAVRDQVKSCNYCRALLDCCHLWLFSWCWKKKNKKSGINSRFPSNKSIGIVVIFRRRGIKIYPKIKNFLMQRDPSEKQLFYEKTRLVIENIEFVMCHCHTFFLSKMDNFDTRSSCAQWLIGMGPNTKPQLPLGACRSHTQF